MNVSNVQLFERDGHTMPVLCRQHAGEHAIILLHAAGVAGEHTYGHLLPMLDKTLSLYVPDLRGMGKNVQVDGQYPSYQIDDIVEDLLPLIASIKQPNLHIVGYSFGGLVAMKLAAKIHNVSSLMLIEPASLEREDFAETQRIRQHYASLANELRQGHLEQAVRDFIKLVCPNSKLSAVVMDTMLARLSMRPFGFANALDSVSSELTTLDRAALTAMLPQTTRLLVGGNSIPEMQQYHQTLAKQHQWQAHIIPGTDHTLPYQKPRRVAQMINDILLS